jgi:hypothetical protein
MFYFTPLPGFFSPFPRGTGSLSVTQEYLALRGGPRGFTRDFSCPVLLGIQLGVLNFRLQDFHLLWCIIQMLRLVASTTSLSHYPDGKNHRFRLFPLRSPLLWKSSFLSLPPATKMFQFAGSLAPAYGFRWPYLGLPHSEIFGSIACFQLPEAYRR